MQLEMFIKLVLAGMSMSGQAAQPVAAAAPSPSDNLIVYRANAEPVSWAPTVKVDGIKIVALPNRHYTSTHVTRGVHTVTTSWPFISRQRSSLATITVSAEEPHFLIITGVSRYGGGYTMTLGSRIAEVDPTQARPEIASCCKFKAPK